MDAFVAKTRQTQLFIDEIQKQKCPICATQKLKVLTMELGDKGWEAKTRCADCGTTSIYNNTGFHVEASYHSEAKK